MNPAGTRDVPDLPDGPEPHLVVDDVEAPALDDGSWHHLLRVRRMAVGSVVTVTDGRGSWRRCRLATTTSIEPDGGVVFVDRRQPEIVVAFALTKGDKPELVVQKLTELGVDRIVPFRAARSVVRWDPSKAAAARRRWMLVARSAVEQSRRCWTPVVDPVCDVAALADLGAARVDRGGAPPSLARSVVAVGPEGGWDDHERQLLPVAVGLGDFVLRAETAALTAGGVLCSLRSGLVTETGDGAQKPEKSS